MQPQEEPQTTAVDPSVPPTETDAPIQQEIQHQLQPFPSRDQTQIFENHKFIALDPSIEDELQYVKWTGVFYCVFVTCIIGLSIWIFSLLIISFKGTTWTSATIRILLILTFVWYCWKCLKNIWKGISLPRTEEAQKKLGM